MQNDARSNYNRRPPTNPAHPPPAGSGSDLPDGVGMRAIVGACGLMYCPWWAWPEQTGGTPDTTCAELEGKELLEHCHCRHCHCRRRPPEAVPRIPPFARRRRRCTARAGALCRHPTRSRVRVADLLLLLVAPAILHVSLRRHFRLPLSAVPN